VDADTLAIENEEALDIEFRFVATDGREVWVQMTKSEAEELALELGSQVFVATKT